MHQDICNGGDRGSSTPTPQWGQILPQEELCWEPWGGGDSPQGACGSGLQAANKISALFLWQLASSGSHMVPLPLAPFSGIFIMGVTRVPQRYGACP